MSRSTYPGGRSGSSTITPMIAPTTMGTEGRKRITMSTPTTASATAAPREKVNTVEAPHAIVAQAPAVLPSRVPDRRHRSYASGVIITRSCP